MLYWLDRESPWRATGFNLGVCACRNVAGKPTKSQHARCRAWDFGLPLVNGKPNPVGHAVVAALLPKVGQLGITEIIWNRTRWSASAPRGAPYRGVSPHYDHIHAAHTLTATRLLNVPTIRAVMAGPAAPPQQQPPTPPPYRPPAPFDPPAPGVPMKFFITDPAYGIRLVITDGTCVMDYGVTKLEQLVRTDTHIGGPMSPTAFAQFCAKYPGGRVAMGHLPA